MRSFVFVPFAALIALLLSCTPLAPRPTSFGFIGRQCQPVRIVHCVPDEDMDSYWCTGHVSAAIQDINRAAGRTVLALGPDIDSTPEAVETTVLLGNIVLWADKLDNGRHGITNFVYTRDEHDHSTDCIGVTMVRLDTSLIAGPDTDHAESVVTHELLHAIGAGHVMQSSAYPTIMAPGPNTSWSSPIITRFDANALRGMYGERL